MVDREPWALRQPRMVRLLQKALDEALWCRIQAVSNSADDIPAARGTSFAVHSHLAGCSQTRVTG